MPESGMYAPPGVVAPNSAIALTIQYFEEKAGGPTGTAFALWDNLIIGGEPVN